MLNMLSAVAEMERDLLIERTQSGLQRAKLQGKILGRPVKTNDVQRNEIIMLKNGGKTITELSKAFNVSRASIMRITGDLS